ncbi:hypothetical protein BDF21DRAFT_430201, partial [Thamnidium elegans]
MSKLRRQRFGIFIWGLNCYSLLLSIPIFFYFYFFCGLTYFLQLYEILRQYKYPFR